MGPNQGFAGIPARVSVCFPLCLALEEEPQTSGCNSKGALRTARQPSKAVTWYLLDLKGTRGSGPLSWSLRRGF